MIEAAATTMPPAAAATRPRLGFAGVGWIGRHRLEAMVQAQSAIVTAVYDPASGAGDAIASIAPDAARAGSFEELLKLPLDGIVIATPSALHARQAIAALENGKAVFCQKPLARTAAETEAVIAAARAADRRLGVDLSYRGHSGVRKIREMIADGTLGRIYAVEATFHNAYGPDKAWFYDARLSGGGCLLDLGIHLIDLALWSLGFPRVEQITSCLLAGGSPLRDREGAVEDYAAVQLTLAGGTSVQFACSWKAPAGCDARIALTFFGTEGGASFENVDGSFYHFTARHFLRNQPPRTLTSPPEAWGGVAAIEWCRQLALHPGFDPEIEHLSALALTLDRLYGRAP